jgi:hypothetical protein
MGFLDKLKGMTDDLKKVTRDIQNQIGTAAPTAPLPPPGAAAGAPPGGVPAGITSSIPGAPPLSVPGISVHAASLPGAGAVDQATLAPDAPRMMRDWDRWLDPGDVGIGTVTNRRTVGQDWWEGLVFEGTDGRSVQAIAFDLDDDLRTPAMLRAAIHGAIDLPTHEYGTDALAVGTDDAGLPSGIAAIADTGILVRLVGVPADGAGIDAAGRLVNTSVSSLPG